ncbi:MAG: pyruvate:ferredoxin (flavodoxin) oxidoreductase [Actinobacteria bacterium]|nr:pyruvate:ferredoxin (flavodoxin) oxidoreductase [Actinomycetota bacterium]
MEGRAASACIDGNEAAALVAYALSEVIAIYPITPASPMGELSDEWAAAGKPNFFGDVPHIIEMQSEAGAAGALHGALQRGALATTFTASQGLLLMLPNMFKIAGELTPTVIHVAARTVATHALSIFGDHSDVMAVRSSGFAMLASSSVQEAHDLALVAHAASLESRVPFLHFFDGFRTSHEVNEIELLDADDMAALLDEEWIGAHRARALSPDHPFIRGTAQNPDAFFQAREAINPFYDALPAVAQRAMDRLGARTGRHYHLVDYAGAPDADRVIVLMGSGAGAGAETVEALCEAGERVGLLTVHLFRPFPTEAFLAALPETATRIAVLDRTKEPGAAGEPLYEEVVTAFAEAAQTGRPLPTLIGGRYGLSSKQFSPAMVKGVFDELAQDQPRRRITVGIVDDVGGTSIKPDLNFRVNGHAVEAVMYGLGSDGTVSAAKTAAKVVGEHTPLFAQGYFAYDSRKAGQLTASHLRFSDQPIRSTYLIEEADVVACHQFGFLYQRDILKRVRAGGTVLLNSPYPPDAVWDRLPAEVQARLIDGGLKLYVVDAHRIAREVGLPGRINWVMLGAFFGVADVMPTDRAAGELEDAIREQYARLGPEVVDRNLAALHRGVEEVTPVAVHEAVTGSSRRPAVPSDAPDFVQAVTGRLIAGEGDLLPVSAFPVDGTFPSGTAQYEKRGIAQEIPVWDPDLCIDCGKCAIVCPHAAMRLKAYVAPGPPGAPEGFPSREFRSRELPGHRLVVQVAPDDCTGCGICVDVCPAESKETPGHKSLDMLPAREHRNRERANFEYFLAIPELDRSLVAHDATKTSQLLQPLFEFSGACAGCGETPYLKLLTQLSGDRLLIANATGCSSIFGGNLPTTPWSTNVEGRGPAWSNSLFEDNAEFGLGMRLALDQQIEAVHRLLAHLTPELGPELVDAIVGADQSSEAGVEAQRGRVAELVTRLDEMDTGDARRLAVLSEALVRKTVWIVGGDGWAYDIGFGGVDHVLATGRDVNLLVLDTEVYSNTGGQASKATPRGAVARFAQAGKRTPKKDLGLLATAYGNVYVAQVAIGANDRQTVKALVEAEAWPGPSLVIAYSTCIPAHGIEAATSMTHQKDAVHSGYWPLYRYHPGATEHEHPFSLDSHDPTVPVREFALGEVRFAALHRSDPEKSEHLLALAQADVEERWRLYRQLAGLERTVPSGDGNAQATSPGRPRRR